MVWAPSSAWAPSSVWNPSSAWAPSFAWAPSSVWVPSSVWNPSSFWVPPPFWAPSFVTPSPFVSACPLFASVLPAFVPSRLASPRARHTASSSASTVARKPLSDVNLSSPYLVGLPVRISVILNTKITQFSVSVPVLSRCRERDETFGFRDFRVVSVPGVGRDLQFPMLPCGLGA